MATIICNSGPLIALGKVNHLHPDVVTFNDAICDVISTSSTELTVTAPGGNPGPVNIQVCNDAGCSESRSDLLSYVWPVTVPEYGLEGQVLPEDYYWGYEVRGANLDGDPSTVELFVFVDGNVLNVIWNDSTAPGAFSFERKEEARIENSTFEGGLKDVAFLDLDGDTIADYAYVAVGNRSYPDVCDDRLFRIDTAQRAFIGYEGLIEDEHLFMVALTSRPGRLGDETASTTTLRNTSTPIPWRQRLPPRIAQTY